VGPLRILGAGARIRLAGMQPPERSTGAVPVVGGPVPAVVGGRLRNRRLRLWLAMVLGIVVLLCLGGVGVAISLYDGATKIQRSEPDAVVDSFLRAYLMNRDDKEVALFTCKTGLDLAAIAALRSEFVTREKEFDVKVVVTWGTLTVSNTGPKSRSVATDLIIAGTKNGDTQSRRTETWSFGVVDQDGWRVCSAAKQA
jgi:hypothetical protein